MSELESRVCELEEFTNEMKRYTQKNNVIISGLPIQKPVCAYAEVVSTPNPVSSEFSSESETVLVDAVYPHPSNAALFKSTRSQVVQFIDEFMCGSADNHYWSRRASSRADRIPPDVRGNVSADMSGTVSSIVPAQAARCAECRSR